MVSSPQFNTVGPWEQTGALAQHRFLLHMNCHPPVILLMPEERGREKGVKK
jgi:hypothetical protein